MFKLQININGHWATFIVTSKRDYAFKAFKRYSRSNQPGIAGREFRLMVLAGGAA